MKREKILISACLVGEKVRYDGKDNKSESLDELLEKYDLVPFCSEVVGGLPVPRNPSEIKNNKVMNMKGKDVTHNYLKGATLALELCQYLGITIAILKDHSPACGVHQIYDGSFQHQLINGEGITTKLLQENGIKIYSEKEIALLINNDLSVVDN